MRLSRCSLFAAIGCALLTAPAWSAPDQTLGVAFMAAFVSENGGVDPNFSTGAVSATRIAIGRYDVVFNRSVVGCFAVGNTNSVNSAPLAATVSVAVDSNPNTFDVLINSTDGTNSDEDFQLLVFCPR